MPRLTRTALEQRGLYSDAELPIRLWPYYLPGDVLLDGPPGESFLVWRLPDDESGLRRSNPHDHVDVLLRFARLAAVDDQDIHQFAQRYGVLELCRQHGLPAYHRRSPRGLDYRYYRLQLEEFLAGLKKPTAEDFEYFQQLLRDGGYISVDTSETVTSSSAPAAYLTNAPIVTEVTWGPIKRREPDAMGQGAAKDNGTFVRAYHEGYGDVACAPTVVHGQKPGQIGMYREPVAAWRRWSRKLQAILLLAADLNDGVRGQDDLWAAAAWLPRNRRRVPKDLPADTPVIRPPGFDPDHEQETLDILRASAGKQAIALGQIVSRLAASCGVTPSVEWRQEERGGRYQLLLGSHQTAHLFGTLVMSLIAVLASEHGPIRCTECGNAWIVENEGRRPRRDRGRFCGDACREVAERRVKRKSARRSRGGRTST